MEQDRDQTHPHIFTPTRPTGCQAFAQTVGRQCGRRGNPYCNARGHQEQEGACLAINRDSKRCMAPIADGRRGVFCEQHEEWATLDETPCRGYKINGDKCYRRVPDIEYPFCLPSHDVRSNYVDPQVFRQDGLRYRVLGTLVARDGHDLYNPDRTILEASSKDEVDHIGELQQVAFIIQFVNFEDDEEKDDVVKFFRDEVANRVSNLCLTSNDTNARKGVAVTHSLHDITKVSMLTYDRPDARALTDIRSSAFDVPVVATFNDRLRGEGLGRISTRAIRREMAHALRSWRDLCLDQGESPVYNAVGVLAQNLYATLDLDFQVDGLGVD